MTRMISSYATGAWHTAPEGTGTSILDPSNGDVVAEVSSKGLNFESMVVHAREVGGPALQAMTFHERALLLKKLAAYLTEHREEVHADYATSGSTVPDARIDVEGGIQLLSVYSKSGLRELPNDTILLDGEPEMLGSTDFARQTIYSSRPGVAVFINAFNFPVWGILEKLAPAVLAGLPVIVKPATATAHLAQITARQIIESRILPQGSFQFVAGSLGTLLNELGGQDYIGFTGSAYTAAVLRAHPAVVERSTQLNVEADSLNATVLGPDAGPATEEFSLFVKTVVRDMTSKAGQKCTSIRRVLVPNDRIDEVISALRESLSKIVVGDPREESTRMGPLVSASQRRAVEASVRELMEVADVAIGGLEAIAACPGGADNDLGFFPPTVLLATQARDERVHSVEAFGPVCTVLGYDAPEEVVELIALGGGSLVASVVSCDADFVRSVVLGSAPFHGRIFVLNHSIAKAPPPAAVLPQLIHGGPGRSGGGEELGGMRGVRRLMQATSVATHPDMLVSLTDRWNPGAAQLTSQVHPFRRYLEELRLGDTLHTGSRLITLEDIEHFAHFTGDTFYAHMDDEAAKSSPLFEGRVAHGYFILAAAAGLFVDPEPGPVLANFGLENLRFAQPVYPGDEIKLRLTAKHKALRPGATWGEVTWNVEVTNQRDEPVATYDLLTINASQHA